MGLAGASNSAVTGLQSQSTNIAIASDNIANASTTGYKSVKGVFSTLVTSAGSSNSYSSGGVSITPQTLVDQQGLIQTTGNATDLAISGSGFFAVQDSSGTLLLTRAGSFTVNNKGILTNSAGFSLLGWPLDSDGLLPGADGNANTTASESTASLVEVDTNSASGAASATTTVKTGMNLKASQGIFQGATVTIAPSSDNNNSIAKGDILIPTTGMQVGDQFTFTSNSTPTTFEYGGFAKSKNIGESALYGASADSTTFSTSDGDLTEGDRFSITTTSSGTVTFKFVQSSPSTSSGQFNSLATLATAINATNGLTARTDGTRLYISSDTANQAITFADVTTDSDMVAELGLSNVTIATTGVNRFNTISGLSILVNAQDQLGSVIYDPTSAATLDIFASDPLQTLTFTKVINIATINLQSDNNGVNTPTEMIVPTEVDSTVTSTMIPDVLGTNNGTGSTDAATLSFTDGTTTGTFTYGGIGSSAAISSTNTIFEASTADGLFTDGTGGLDDTDTITFSDGVTACTVTYSNTVPLPTTSSFNSLSSLASAINVSSTAAGSSVYARVANDTLYISSNSSANANKIISITNTSGITGAQIMAALGGDFGATSTTATTASIVAAVSTGNSRFSNMTQLNNLISGITGFSTTTPTGTNCTIPITATVTNAQITIGGSDNAMLLDELGIASGAVGDGFFDEMGISSTFTSNESSSTTIQTDATLDITYDPTDQTLNMAGGNITPDFQRNIRMFDSIGTGHNFTLAFLKTGTNEWATEFYTADTLEISDDTNGDGLLVSGTITFNGDGSLSGVSTALEEDIVINWTGSSTPTTFNFNFGTAGVRSGTEGDGDVVGLTDGLRQFDSAFNVDFVQQNGVAAGQFGGLEVSEDGTISAKFSNGQVKAIYKLPIILVPNQNGLFQKTGNVFSLTQESGDVNLKEAGIGGSGVIVPEALEGSTADIASELTKTISIQANYNANATLISTVKAMEDELNRRL